ncbi:Cadmium, cobalt and zinc/H(+)-K(+) antiporter [Paraglaciecola mesophila]|uniref:Cadmium, cobalt and zinc/H(+)-K(+) antiporter n=1 Tax=Paraglaciecola mesophila TaxID=197222 RepID=A0A857JPK5_9ALTE|nr:cation diffusion facilitator family transporter [Paraglaciecola mesophila]QHJ13773.1 Cadmium, cobalt and zinc/H(+)-K(+) antiporter [Paraglaciecola mesophila]
MSECCGVNAQDKEQRTLLWTVLGLNGGMFFVEFIAGWLGQSSGLMADSLDMLADAMVYMVGLYAVGKAIEYKAKAALFNGSLQLVLAGFILFDVLMRIINGSQPQTAIMLWVSFLALEVNLLCFVLLSRYRAGDINMRASWICSRNDMIANVGVIVSAGLVVWLDSAIPDLVIGSIIALIIVQSSWKIVVQAKSMLTSHPELTKGTIDVRNEDTPSQKDQGSKKQSSSCCGS